MTKVHPAIIGIDPGSQGGIACLAGHSLITHKLQGAESIVHALAQANPQDQLSSRVFIEHIPKWCGAAQFAERSIPGSSIASLYGSFMLIVGVCHGFGITPTLLGPIKWQNLVQCRNRERLGRTAWKNKLRARACELYPQAVWPLWAADAILIAHAGLLTLSK